MLFRVITIYQIVFSLFQEFVCPSSSDEQSVPHQIKPNEVWGTDSERVSNSQVLNKTDRISDPLLDPIKIPKPKPLHVKSTKGDKSPNVKTQENDTAVNDTLESQTKPDSDIKTKEIKLREESGADKKESSFRAAPKHVIFQDNSTVNQPKEELPNQLLDKTKNKNVDFSPSQLQTVSKEEKEIPEDVIHRNESFIKQVRSTEEEKLVENEKKGALKSIISKLFGKK